MRPEKNLLNIGWFSSGRGEGSRGLLSFIQARIMDGLQMPIFNSYLVIAQEGNFQVQTHF